MVMILDFERSVNDLEKRIDDLRKVADGKDMNILTDVARLEKKSASLLKSLYKDLSPWQKVMVARHEMRPHTSDYIKALIDDFVPLAGDRAFGEDAAILSGMGRFRGQAVMILGHEKGCDTETRIHHNFGMARPEGYRKARRLMDMAHRFRLPVLTFVDTAGAHPGADAEERGQSEAIAACIEKSFDVETPIVTTIIGEGGSGGAVALAVANKILMLEHAVYSVISPEGCASILWRTREKREEAAAAQKLTAQDLFKFKVIDQIISEPVGGAHRHRDVTIQEVGKAIEKALIPLLKKSPLVLKEERRQKFMAMGRL